VNIRRFKLSKAEKEITEQVPYLYDMFLPVLNLIIEYQGNYWHANPRRYPPGTILNIQNKGPTPVEDIWNRDRDKKEQAERNGYRVVCIWEDEFLDDGLQCG